MDKYNSKYTIYSISEDNFVFNEKNNHFQNIILCNSDELQREDISAFLNQILSAINLQPNVDSLVIPLQINQEIKLNELVSKPPIFILSFGIRPIQLKLNGFEELHKLYKVKDYRLLFGLNLLDYMNNNSQKAELWSAMKLWKTI